MIRIVSFQGSDALREEICIIRMQANVARRDLQSLSSSTFGESWEIKIKEIICWLEKVEKVASDGENCPDDEVEDHYFAIKVLQDTISAILDSIDHPELIGVLW